LSTQVFEALELQRLTVEAPHRGGSARVVQQLTRLSADTLGRVELTLSRSVEQRIARRHVEQRQRQLRRQFKGRQRLTVWLELHAVDDARRLEHDLNHEPCAFEKRTAVTRELRTGLKDFGVLRDFGVG